MLSCKSCGVPLPYVEEITARREFCDTRCRKAYRRKEIKEEGRNEWYSPPDIVEAARQVMGGAIDLDPASCRHANKIVQAARYYTRADDGLSQPWRGRVWLNPPYDKFAPKFFIKCCEEHAAGHVPMACLLLAVHHLTTKWFQRAEQFSIIMCLPSARLKFTGRLAHGNPPMHGSAILGIGVDPDLFRHEFGAIGRIWLT